jgi:hypothetical protein
VRCFKSRRGKASPSCSRSPDTISAVKVFIENNKQTSTKTALQIKIMIITSILVSPDLKEKIDRGTPISKKD